MKKIELKNLIKTLKTNGFYMNCNIPMEYTPGLPIIQMVNSKVYVVIPFLKYKMTGKVDQTYVYPIKYFIKLELPSGKPVSYEDLSSSLAMAGIDFSSPVGYFRHDSIKDLTKQQYMSKKDSLYEMYDKIISALLYKTAYTEADNKAFTELLNLLIEPSLKPLYKALDANFYNKYLS